MNDIQIIEDICLKHRKQLEPVSEEDVNDATQNLENGKATDYAEITPEHLKMAADEQLHHSQTSSTQSSKKQKYQKN